MMIFSEGENNRTVASTKMNTNRYIRIYARIHSAVADPEK